MASHILNVHSIGMPSWVHKLVWNVNSLIEAVFNEILYHVHYMYDSAQIVNRIASILFHVHIFSLHKKIQISNILYMHNLMLKISTTRSL